MFLIRIYHTTTCNIISNQLGLRENFNDKAHLKLQIFCIDLGEGVNDTSNMLASWRRTPFTRT